MTKDFLSNDKEFSVTVTFDDMGTPVSFSAWVWGSRDTFDKELQDLENYICEQVGVKVKARLTWLGGHDWNGTLSIKG